MERPTFGDVPSQTIALSGDLDLAMRSELQQRFEKAANDSKSVTLDLRDVTYMDSSAIGAMIALHRQLREKGGEVRFLLRKNAAYRLLEIAGLVGVFPTQIED